MSRFNWIGNTVKTYRVRTSRAVGVPLLSTLDALLMYFRCRFRPVQCYAVPFSAVQWRSLSVHNWWSLILHYICSFEITFANKANRVYIFLSQYPMRWYVVSQSWLLSGTAIGSERRRHRHNWRASATVRLIPNRERFKTLKSEHFEWILTIFVIIKASKRSIELNFRRTLILGELKPNESAVKADPTESAKTTLYIHSLINIAQTAKIMLWSQKTQTRNLFLSFPPCH